MTEDLNLKTVETVDTSPFRKLVMTIGELPSAFVESMTYYELLAWFVNYLETVIIPTVNNNGEAVEELQDKFIELNTAFIQLKNYVDTYFENLDVQDEINNKLDEMAEAGTLQEIITQYINSTALWMYDNLAGMKAATNLVDGSFAKTLGYTTKNDEGGAWYKIRTKTNDDTTNEKTLIALTDTTLVAELCITNSMNVKQFGAKGDGTTDDTDSIQLCIDNCKNINIPSGTYMVNAVTKLILKTGNKLTLNKDATLKAITNDAQSYAILWLENVTNVEICGGTIEGDRLTHTGEGGEWGHCIRLYGNCDKIYIHDITLKNSWGDGITCKVTGNIKTENVYVYNARRNGYSIAQCESFTSNNDTIENSNGTDPQNGVDIEPDANTEHIKNITFNNLFTKNNAGVGLGIFLMHGDSEPIEVTINNMHDYQSRVAISIAKDPATEGSITITNPYLEASGDSAIRMHRCYDSNLAIKIIRPYILNCDNNGEGSQYGAGISGYVTSTETDAPLGNIEIIEPYIKTAYGAQTTAIVFRSYVSDAVLDANNIKIINPIYLNGDNVYIGKNTNVYFSDEYNVTEFHTDSTYTIDLHQFHGIYTNTATTSTARILTIPDGMDIGRKLKFRNLNASYRLSARLPANDYVRQLADFAQGTIRLAKLGDTIELQKIADHEWIVTDINCTPTVDPTGS